MSYSSDDDDDDNAGSGGARPGRAGSNDLSDLEMTWLL